MNEVLHENLVWSLRALAQDAKSQHDLYPNFVHVADELVLDFDDALSVAGREILLTNPDLASLDSLIDSKGGQSEYWSDAALENSEFWRDIRQTARDALRARALPISAPGAPPYDVNYVEGKAAWLGRIKAWIKRKR